MSAAAIENWPQAAAEAIKGILAPDFRRRRAVLILPSQAVVLKQMRTPRIAPEKSRQVLGFAVGQAIPHVAGELVWDALTAGTYDAEIDHLVVAAKISMFAPILHAIETARVEISAVIPSVLALRAAESRCSPTGESRRLLVETDEWGTTFLQTDGDRFAIRSLATTAPQGPPPEVITAAETRNGTQRLAQEATRTLLHFNRQNHFELPGQIMLASEKEWDPETKSWLGAQLKSQVEILAPAMFESALGGTSAACGITGVRLLGGAAVGLGRAGGSVNLIPAEICEQQEARRRRPWLMAAATLAIAVLLPPILLLRGESALRVLQNAELEKILVPMRAREKRMLAQQTQLAVLQKESERLRRLSDCRTSWLDFFARLQDRLSSVQDVWLERLQTVAPDGDAPMKLIIHGCMLDRGTPPVSEKMKNLVRELRTMPKVGAVEGARFDTGRPYLLRFELVLVLDSSPSL